jgi:tetratricopeptide (TPR) repeat protein
MGPYGRLGRKMALLTIAVMLALHVQSPAAQGRDTRSWYQAYEEGKLALSKNNNSAAIASLEVAKQKGPKPGRSVNTYGDSVTNFNPDYYLGVAYLNLRQFAEADAAFKRVQQANLITPKDKESAAFTAQAAKASLELGLDSAERALAGKQFDQALERARQVAKIRGINAVDLLRATELASKIEQAMNATNPAASPTPAPVPPATPSPTAPATPSPGPTANATSTPYSTPIANVTPTPAATSTPPRPGGKAPPRGPVTPPPVTRDEQAGMILFYRGDYAGAATELSGTVAGPTASARAYFYLACAQAGMVLTGRADRQLLPQAQVNFVAAGGDWSAFEADRQYISPRIREMLGGK